MAEVVDRPEIAVESVCRIVVKARQFHVKEATVEEDYASDPIDEEVKFAEVLAAHGDDPVFQELRSFIRGLNVDEQCELVALMWVGRADYAASEWVEALELAHDEHNKRTAEYLLGTPLVADLLEEGLAAFDLSCADFEQQHL